MNKQQRQQRTNRSYIFFGLTLAITVAFAWLINDFLLGLFWAVIIAVMIYPSYLKLCEKMGGRRYWAAGVALLLLILVVLVPLFFVGLSIVNQAQNLYLSLQNGGFSTESFFDAVQERLPLVDQYLGEFGVDTGELRASIQEQLSELSGTVVGSVFSVTNNALGFIVQLGVVLYLLFFFLAKGDGLVDSLRETLPMEDDKVRRLFQQFDNVVHATIFGSLTIAVIQGTLGGIMFWALGIPAYFLFGIVMIVASLLPVGSAIVWVPTAIVLAVLGDFQKAIIMMVVGSVVIGLVDNLLRPRLVGSRAQMDDWVVLISTLGGITYFGLSGFVVGPMLAAFCITCWRILRQERKMKKGQVV